MKSRIKPLTDEKVLYDKFWCDKFFLPVCTSEQFYFDKFSLLTVQTDKFFTLPIFSMTSALVIEKIGKMGRTDEQSKLVT
jgi:hypothetical protein